MSSEDIAIDAPPTDINPYEVLSVPKTATDAEIRTAYRKLALKTHPDKAAPENKATAHAEFQKIAFAYAVLSDEKRRARYDRTGRTDEKVLNGDDVDDEDFDWESFYKEMWADVVTGDTLTEFKKTYQGSDEEREDLLAIFEEVEGDMDKLFENVMLSDPLADEDRFRKIIDAAIKAGEVEGYPAYVNETKKAKQARKKNAEKESKEAMDYAKKLGVYDKLFGKDENQPDVEEVDDEEPTPSARGKKKAVTTKKKKGGNPEDDPNHPLAALIRSRQKDRGVRATNFFDNLEAKYGQPAAKKGRKRASAEPEPSEEDFLAAQARLNGGASGRNKRTRR
ncbi:hypothetical protein EYR41_002929 [Orbilia oligospora]|uniref:Uncharacterized protein n=1 Tax=Orbilia oligospora TaxID=2813651 RepID=A0A7C8PJ90_ORBOL|nr:hypothetical protein TWF751_004820 [Orbilia oligospora]TGJ70919.1 hypothetical protein EYR41_002929 [Orbilia oligospora]